MQSKSQLVRCALGELQFALALAQVERVVRAVAVARLPGAPAAIMGTIVLRGEILPVADMRARFGLESRAVLPEDQFVIVRTPRRRLALAVDAAGEVVECEPGDIAAADSVVPGLEHVHGVARTRGGFLLIHDVDRFLALDEEARLQEALERA